MTITMYGADWCGDCRRAKAYFDDNDVAFTYIRLDETPDAVDVVLERNNGLKRIPVIVFSDDSHLTEPSNAELGAKLAELAEPVAEGAAVTSDGAYVGESKFAVVDNPEEQRFELQVGGEVAGFASYRRQGDSVMVPHVETFPQHQGQGYAGRLMDGLLSIIRTEGQTIEPVCPFAARHIRENSQYHDLVAQS